MNLGRLFDEVTIPYGDGNQTQAMQIVCGCGCGAKAYFPHMTGTNRKPPSMAAKHFQNKGWLVGSVPKKDLSPQCKRKPKRKDTAMATTQPAAEAPREMSREDRRIINDKLDTVYSKDCYKAPWTDVAVAKDLGVPRDWVAQVRDQFFGPAGSNPLFDDYLTQRDLLKQEFVSISTEQKMLADRYVAFCNKVDELDRIGKRIDREITR